MAQVSLQTRRSAASAPKTFAEAHFRGLEATAELRKRLGSKVRALIAISRGDVDQVAATLGILPWKVRQLAAGSADPTLGEIGRIADACGDTFDVFVRQLLSETAPAPTSL